MNRRITLIRHAKSDWGHPELSDFDRPLNQRGEHDAPFMGDILKQQNIAFDLVLASPARRAITTAKEICNTLDYEPNNIEQKRELYLASATEMLHIIQSVDDAVNHLALVSHNPGITTLVNMLGDMPIGNMPTCGIAILQTGIGSWAELETNTCKTIDFLFPKRFS